MENRNIRSTSGNSPAQVQYQHARDVEHKAVRESVKASQEHVKKSNFRKKVRSILTFLPNIVRAFFRKLSGRRERNAPAKDQALVPASQPTSSPLEQSQEKISQTLRKKSVSNREQSDDASQNQVKFPFSVETGNVTSAAEGIGSDISTTEKMLSHGDSYIFKKVLDDKTELAEERPDEFFDASEERPDEFFDASDEVVTDSIYTSFDDVEQPKTDSVTTKGSADNSEITYANWIFQQGKKITGMTQLYNSLLSFAEYFLRKKIDGIKGADINNLLVAMNKVHVKKEPQTIHLQQLTLSFLDPPYELSDAKITFHQITTPDHKVGYKHINVGISIDANLKYSSADGTQVSGSFKLENAKLDLHFEHDQFIKKLLTSANVVTTVAESCGALLLPKLSRISGLNRIRKLFKLKVPSAATAPTVQSLFRPTNITLNDLNLQIACQNTSIPSAKADFNLKADCVAYSLAKVGGIKLGNAQISLNGDQCAKLLPVSVNEKFMPLLHSGHTEVNVATPQVLIKNKDDNWTVTIPEISVNTQGDITIQNGQIEGMNLELFTQPSSGRMIALKTKKIIADHMHVPASSFGVPVDEQGYISCDNMNMVFISEKVHPPVVPDKDLSPQKPTLLQRLKGTDLGWASSKAASVTVGATSQTKEMEEPDKTLNVLALNAQTINTDLAGNINIAGQMEEFKLWFGESDDIHIQADTLQASKFYFGKRDELSSSDEKAATPLNFSGTTNGFHAKVSLGFLR